MRLDTKQKIIRYSLIGFGIAMLFFLIVFNGVWFGDKNQPPKGVVDMSFGLSFAIPLLVAIICFLASGYFKSFTKNDAINQIEKQYRNGIISTEHYKQSLREIEMFELEKNKLKAQIEMEKELHKENLMKEIDNKIKETITEEEISNNNNNNYVNEKNKKIDEISYNYV